MVFLCFFVVKDSRQGTEKLLKLIYIMMAEVINYLISLGVMIYFLFVFKQKSAENIDQKIAGIPVKNLIGMIYLGIAINAILIAHALLK